MLTELWISQRYLRTAKKERIISLAALISTIGVAVGVMVLIVVISVMSGFDRYLQDKMVGTNAHLTLDFYKGTASSVLFIDKLKKIPHIVAVSPSITGQAFIREGSGIIGVEVRGIDSKLQSEVTKLQEYIKKGSLQADGNELIIGGELASRLNSKCGDKITLISPVTLKPTEFVVKGIFNTGMYMYDVGLVMTSIKGAQDFFNLGNLVSGLAIKTDDIYKIEAVKEAIYKNIKQDDFYGVSTWADANRNFLAALKLEKVVMFIVVTMTTVVAAFGIISTLMMSVMTKIKDIGILRSTGAKAKTILEIFLFQGLSIGMVGIIFGVLGGVGMASSLNRITDFISRLIGRELIPKDIYYFDRIPTYFKPADMFLIVFCALMISLLASIYPAIYAMRINPSEAVRHE